MKLELKPLQAEDTDRFASEMQEAFQLAVGQSDEKMPLPVLPRCDIDASLAHPQAEALVAWLDGRPVGGAVIFPNQETKEYECALLYVAAAEHGEGIGSELWQAIEAYYPDAAAWTLCTPYFETRNIHFYLRKCGFRIVDLFEEADKGEEHHGDERGYMFSFVKRLDGRWA